MVDDKERLMKCRMKDLKEVNERSITIIRKEGQEIIIVNKRQIRRLIKQWTADSYQENLFTHTIASQFDHKFYIA